jgi:hypothetical protein
MVTVVPSIGNSMTEDTISEFCDSNITELEMRLDFLRRRGNRHYRAGADGPLVDITDELIAEQEHRIAEFRRLKAEFG